MKKIFIPIALVMVLLLSACGNSNAKAKISEEKAKEIALTNAGLKKEDVTFKRTEKDREDGKTVYEIEFYTKDNREYDYEIDANTGDIISYDSDAESIKPSATEETQLITEEKAKEIALAKVPGATTQDIRKFKKDRDDGRYVYEGEILYNKTEYDFEIDAHSGEIISWEHESAKNEIFD